MRLVKLLFVGFGMFCLSATTAFGQTNEATTTAAATTVATENVITAKTIKVKVKGVGCSRDLQAISTNVAKVNGVTICETLKKGATTTFSVTFNPSVASEEAIHTAVENTAGCSNQSARPYKVKL